MSAVVPRLKKSFTSPQITKAIEDSVKALGYERIRKDQLDVITKFIEDNDVSSPCLLVWGKACVLRVYLWYMTS